MDGWVVGWVDGVKLKLRIASQKGVNQLPFAFILKSDISSKNVRLVLVLKLRRLGNSLVVNFDIQIINK